MATKATTYVSLVDLAERWDCSTRTVRRLISSGQLAAFRPTPGVIRISETEVARFEAKASGCFPAA
ncbi:helix-turn-helix domain-containing protein [Gordonia aichiensis]|uniref:Helix-turn-helix domain-containing protein n=1 Tax=Gordonia aichiensis NBRC 108223 TaxID=1220583 RepID=L7KR72_9ACTN|nr:helix-turn-helix domain-containing protein [Gordonia aichiensis]GAC50218.1 hypothetical protein GOACH_22_00150 [Gordonia aichiensis NBRC 108223]